MSWPKSVSGFAYLLIVSVACFSTPGLCADSSDEDALGRKYAEDVMKQYKMVKDPATLDRVRRVGQELAKIANQVEIPATYGRSEITKFNYEFYVVEDKDPNAFSLPGGKVFVNSGLLKMVTSDDELAGVLAHEVAHAAHHHVARILKQQEKIEKYVALITLIGLMTNVRSSDLNNVLMGAGMLQQGQVSGYTMQAEQDADRTAVAYLAKSKFNPIGIVDFMRKLEERHDANPTVPLGIYQTHPSPFRRVAVIRKAAREYGVKIDARKMRGVAYADSVETSRHNGQYEVVVCGKVLCTPAAVDKESSKARADGIARSINTALDGQFGPQDIQVDENARRLVVKGQTVLQVEAKDLALGQEDCRAMLDKARTVLARAAWADWLVNTCDAMEENQP